MEVPDYLLPEAAIAQTPVEPRDSARLLDALSGPEVIHRHIYDLPDLFGPGDVVVVNNTRVIAARLTLQKTTGGSAEVLLIEPDSQERAVWTALVRPGRRLPPGTPLGYRTGPGRTPEGGTTSAGPTPDATDAGSAGHTADDPVLVVEDVLDEGLRRVRFLVPAAEVMARAGSMALPPYIKEELADPERYQTVFAAHPGSVAAPTAGLHITASVLDRLRRNGVRVAPVDLAVGLATFRPVTAEKAEDHVMHEERYHVPEETWELCRRADRVVAIGTTSVRALETVAATGRLEGASDLFIVGDYPFGVVDVLVTNFHMPRSSLLLLLEAFCGPRWRDLYASALSEGYRFLSFGDAMVVGRR